MSVVTEDLGKMYRKAAIKAMERGLRTDDCFVRTGDEESLPATITHTNNFEPKWVRMDDFKTVFSSTSTTSPSDWGMRVDKTPCHIEPLAITIPDEYIWKDNPVTIDAERCPYCSVRYLPEDRFCVGCGAPV